jgi:hypothetical protein
MRTISQQELKYRYEELRNGLGIDDEEIMNMLINTRMQDDMGIEIIIRGEGEKTAINNFLMNIEDKYLSEQDLDTIYKFKEKNSLNWDFLSDEQLAILRNTEKFYNNIKKDYIINRADLMILRKEVTNFVTVTLKRLIKDKNIDNTDRFDEFINYIINNYTYSDTIKELGFNPSIDEDTNEIFLERFRLDEKTLNYVL